jgi:predicted lipoprotein with Yx(FWY)xxD motif
MRTSILSGSIVAVAMLLAACGGSGSATQPPAATPVAATAAPATPAPVATEPATGASEAPVGLADTPLGKVLVDGKGMTLYMFTADSGGSSSCYDDCATNWPPLLGTAVPDAGLDASLFGTTERKDGSSQVVFNGMPLYLFAGDTAAGETNGQGLNTKWYVLGADGTPIK